MGIAEFLTARLDERERRLRESLGSDEDQARQQQMWEQGDLNEGYIMDLERELLADVAAMRAILTEHVNQFADDDPRPRCIVDGNWPCSTLRALASVYADHPDFDPAWTVET